MQVSYEWLTEFVDLVGITPEEISHKLTMSGLEVEEVEYKKPIFTNIITAEIVKLEQHPNADKLRLATINTGDSTKTVVCGAQNIEVGQIIPYASIGSKVFSRKTGEIFELTPAEIRGVKSEGMLCSCDELGLEGLQEEDGIFVLNRIYKTIPLNEPLEKIMGLSEEIIFHMAPTANRGDQMSVVGIAREISALFNRKMKFDPEKEFTTKKSNDFKVEIKDDETCKYYSIAVLDEIEIKESPDFIKRRVEACGMRAISNVVDITNYVLLELGTPLHAFDYSKLDDYLCVRYAKEGETLVTIDEIERKLTDKSVVIATKDKPVCIGGVFGGLNSEIDDNTKKIALEAAYFTPHTNRKSARSVGYRSEASARFERGVDIELVKAGLVRATELLQKYAGAKLVSYNETGENKSNEITITLRDSEIQRILGIEIPFSEIKQITQNLGFELIGNNEVAARFKVPSHRTEDVTREIDLIEEISRIYGYDKIAPSIPNIEQGATISFESKNLKKLNEIMLNSGFSEIVTTSLVGENFVKEYMHSLCDKTCVQVTNPQSEEHTTLRQALMPNMLSVVKRNFDNSQKAFKFYEIGKTYFHTQEATQSDSGVIETRKLSGCIFGSTNNELWNNKKAPDFYSLKGVLEKVFEEFGLSKRAVFSALEEKDFECLTHMHPYMSANISLMGKNRAPIGYIGKIHPVLADKMKLNQDLFVFEINLDAILEAINETTVKYKKLALYPSVTRDIAFSIDEHATNDEILKVIKKIVDNKLYKGAKVFDIYQGEHIEQGKKSLCYRVTLQDETQTLTDEIIDTEMKKIREGLEKNIKGLALR